jgi:MFS family permease
MSSCTPLCGRLSHIFSARNSIFVSTIILSIGALLTSQAVSLPVFLAGRAVAGVGGAGVLSVSIILVIELTGKKRRGLFIGCVNTGFTTGVALGAVIAGALLPRTGWVSACRNLDVKVTYSSLEIHLLDSKSASLGGWGWCLL